MANHGYVYTDKELTLIPLCDNLNIILKKYFYDIAVADIDDDCIYITINFSGIKYITQSLWISDQVEYGSEENDKFIKYDEPKTIKENNVIEIRHGHSSIFCWWFDYFITNELANFYNGYIRDDGHDDIIQPTTISDDFNKYLNRSQFMIRQWNEEMKWYIFCEYKTNGELVNNFLKDIDRNKKLNSL